ncbi:MAG: hypothetical protein PUC18_13265 [Prevotellaceae bacterium]|nr:hypothetical protein [Prevotellaceae bacterium]
MKKFNVMKSADSDQHVGIWYVNQDVTQSDINEAVYAVLCVVAQAVLDRSTLFVEGNYTASQLAGSFDWGGFLVMPCAENAKHLYMAPEVCVKAGEYQCNFMTKDIFWIMSEWEGVAGIKSKDVHTFYCEPHRRENIVDAKIKPYRRDRVLNPSRVSLKSENDRIANKFAVLGELVQRLTSEGMRKAMSVLMASNPWDKNYEIKEMAREYMRLKLWRDYGVEGSRPVSYCAADFKDGPACWMSVDEDYVKELRQSFQQLLDAFPAPSDIKINDLVQFKNQENVAKKYRGKFLCENVFPQLSTDGQHIDWYVGLRIGRFSTTHHRVESVEKWVEPEKPKKKDKKRKGVESKVQEKTVNPEPTIEDRLRAALRKQLGVAA